MDKLEDLLKSRNIIPTNEKVITGKNLYFKKTREGDTIWVCNKCNTIHLHPSCGTCSNCCNKTLIEKKSQKMT